MAAGVDNTVLHEAARDDPVLHEAARHDPVLHDAVLTQVDTALLTLGRPAVLRRLGDRVRIQAGLSLDRAAYPALKAIAETGPVRLSDLAAGLGVSISTASRQVKDLEESGLVLRTSDPSDGRAAMLALAPEGKRILKRLRESWRQALSDILSDWPEADRRTLAGLLARLADGFVTYGRTP